MPALAQWQEILSTITVPAYFLVAAVLFQRNLWKSYPFFCSSLLLEGIAAVASTYFVELHPTAFGRIVLAGRVYLIFQPLLGLSYVFIVVEVFRKVFGSYKGIARWAQYFLIISLLIALIIAFSTSFLDTSTGRHAPSLLLQVSVAHRAITTALTLHLIFVAAFLAWMPIPLPSNTLRHSILFFVYFLVQTLTHFFWNRVGTDLREPLNLILSSLTLSALLGWVFLLRSGGEQLPGRPMATPDSARLLTQLDALNQALAGKRP
jgi:hypothetical protein